MFFRSRAGPAGLPPAERTNANLRVQRFVSRYWWGGEEEYAPKFVSSAVDVHKITDHVNNRRAARYVLSEMRALARQDGFRLVLAMDGVGNAIYVGKGLESYEVGKLNRLVGEVASELDACLGAILACRRDRCRGVQVRPGPRKADAGAA
jgi:hypothetical protein